MAGWAAAAAAAAAAHYAPFDIYSQFEGINSACKYISAISALQRAYLVAHRRRRAASQWPCRNLAPGAGGWTAAATATNAIARNRNPGVRSARRIPNGWRGEQRRPGKAGLLVRVARVRED